MASAADKLAAGQGTAHEVSSAMRTVSRTELAKVSAGTEVVHQLAVALGKLSELVKIQNDPWNHSPPVCLAFAWCA
jgi:hypothetical protein